MCWIEFQGISPFLRTHCCMIVLLEAISIIVLWSGAFADKPAMMKLKKKVKEQTWRMIYRDYHDDVIKWKHFPRYWPMCGEFSAHKALKCSLICAWTNGWVNNRAAGDLKRHRAHYDVTVMYDSSCEDLMSAAEAPIILTKRPRVILPEVCKSINMLNADCLNHIFKSKIRTTLSAKIRMLLQPKNKTTTFFIPLRNP